MLFSSFGLTPMRGGTKTTTTVTAKTTTTPAVTKTTTKVTRPFRTSAASTTATTTTRPLFTKTDKTATTDVLPSEPARAEAQKSSGKGMLLLLGGGAGFLLGGPLGAAAGAAGAAFLTREKKVVAEGAQVSDGVMTNISDWAWADERNNLREEAASEPADWDTLMLQGLGAAKRLDIERNQADFQREGMLSVKLAQTKETQAEAKLAEGTTTSKALLPAALLGGGALLWLLMRKKKKK